MVILYWDIRKLITFLKYVVIYLEYYHSRFKKRPGVDQFLQTVASADFEVIIFTSENAFMIWPVIDKLDPENKFITYRLFRDSTHFTDGVHVKNLDGLNRDLSKVSDIK